MRADLFLPSSFLFFSSPPLFFFASPSLLLRFSSPLLLFSSPPLFFFSAASFGLAELLELPHGDDAAEIRLQDDRLPLHALLPHLLQTAHLQMLRIEEEEEEEEKEGKREGG